jgi:membrane protein
MKSSRRWQTRSISFITTPRTDLVSIGFLITIWAAMAGVDSVRIGLNRAYNVRERRSTFVSSTA